MKFYFLGMLQIWEAGIQNQGQKVACVQTPTPHPLTPQGKIGEGKGQKAELIIQCHGQFRFILAIQRQENILTISLERRLQAKFPGVNGLLIATFIVKEVFAF